MHAHEELTLHERNKLMEGKEGGYKFLSPQERWARQVRESERAS
jgi:hypothetical protein